MKTKIFWPLVFIIGIFISTGCRPGTADQPVPQGPGHLNTPVLPNTPALPKTPATTTPSPPAPETNAAAVQPDCQAPYASATTDRPRYQLDATLNITEQKVSVQQMITYPNLSGDWLGTLKLVVDPNWIENVFTLSEVKISKTPHQNSLLSGGYLTIALDTPLPPSCAIQINLKYTLDLPAQTGLFGYTSDQIMLTNWYPFIPPYHPDWHWQTNNPAAFGEHQVYPLADFEVHVDLQEKGKDSLIAAPAPAVPDGARTSYTLENARTFSLAILPDHTRVSRTINGTTLNVYTLVAEEDTAQAALDILAESVATYENLFGPYPFENLTAAEINMDDGMEYDGIFFVGRGIFSTYDQTRQNIFTLLLAHETAHNWWFSQVGSDQAIDPWLDEALATYCELLYLESNSPELVEWWWEFRVNLYAPFGPVNVSIYDYYEYEAYRQAVYLRGALFLQAVRQQIGEKDFQAFLRQYYAAGHGQVATTSLFFETLQKISPGKVDSTRHIFFGDW
jgi:hypothetical protein